MDELKACPFCGGKFSIEVCDDEGNIHEEAGYEQNPWSGLGYKITHSHEENEKCPIAKYSEDGAEMGIWIYDTMEEAIEAINRRAHPENKPMTVEYLRKINQDMNNRRWIWIEILICDGRHESAYYRVQSDYTRDRSFCCGYPGAGFSFDFADYGKTWLAYVCKPEVDK